MTPAHMDMAPVLAALVLILLGGRLAGSWFERLGQSAVLGELLAGVVLGNLGLAGFHAFEPIRDLPAIDVLALLGLAVVSGLIAAANHGDGLALFAVLWILAKSVLFLVGAVAIGSWLAPRLMRAARQRGEGWPLTAALAFCLSLAWLAAR